MKRLLATAVLALTVAGCSNPGTYAVVGDVSAPVDISDASDTFTVRALFSMKGAKAWSARNSHTTITYTNAYTNAYLFGMVETSGVQDFSVDVEPTVDTPEDAPVKTEETEK